MGESAGGRGSSGGRTPGFVGTWSALGVPWTEHDAPEPADERTRGVGSERMSVVAASHVPALRFVRELERATRRALTCLEDGREDSALRESLHAANQAIASAPNLSMLREHPIEIVHEARRLVWRTLDMASECRAWLERRVVGAAGDDGPFIAESIATFEKLRAVMDEADHDLLDVLEERTLSIDESGAVVPWDEMRARVGWQ